MVQKGILYYKSHQELYELLKELMNNREFVHKQLLKYSDIVRKTYSWRNISQAYQSVIERLCEPQEEFYGNFIHYDQIIDSVYRMKNSIQDL